MAKKQGGIVNEFVGKASDVIHRMDNFEIEKEYAEEKINEFSIMLCGSPRVGKSALINALCGKEVAPTSASLDACTKDVQCYSTYNTLKRHDKQVTHKINFWDTQGLECWSKDDVHAYVKSVLKQARPICMIYCASPGSYAKLDQVEWLVQKCGQHDMFCALVCTNMMQSARRDDVMKDFKKILNSCGTERKGDHEIIYFGKHKCLCTMVNSKTYVDPELEINKEAEGVDELIFGIMTSLTDEKIEGWVATILENRSFWTRCGHKVIGFFNEHPMGTAIKGASSYIISLIVDIISSKTGKNNVKN